MQLGSFPLLSAAGVALLLSAQQPDLGDIRNLNPAHTKTHFASPVYQTLPQWSARRPVIRRQILTAAGLNPLPARTPLHPIRRLVVDRAAYRIEKVAIETMPGYFLAGNLYLPVNRIAKSAAVLIPQGHWKKGRIEHRADYSTPTLGINLARQGHIAFAYDMVGYNELDDFPHKFGQTRDEILWSFSPLGLQLWNSIRALDFIESLPQTDPKRIAVTGASGGATQTFLLAAVDDRIAASAPVVMVSAHFQGDDACEMAPGLRIDTNNLEIAAMIAPKPMLLVSSSHDWTKHTPQLEYPAIQSIYQTYQLPTRLHVAHIDAPHNYNRQSREAVYRFLKQVFQRRSNQPIESASVDFDVTRLAFSPDERSAFAPLTKNQLFVRWKQQTLAALQAMSPVERRAHLEEVLNVRWPANVQRLQAGSLLLLTREDSGERVPAYWKADPSPSRTLIVHPKGMKNATLPTNKTILAVDVYQIGLAAQKRVFTHSDYLTFHRSDDANRVQDVLTGLALLAEGSTSPIELHCPGRAAVWCLLATMIAPVETRLLDDLPTPSQTTLLIPGLARAGLALDLKPQATH